jgi:IclR family KDG regulon transcriptional repressor
MQAKDTESYEIQSVKKTFRLIEALSTAGEMSITELGAAVDLNKGAVFRFLATLKRLGYIEQNTANEKYRLSLKLFEIGSNVVTMLNEVREAHTVMEQLAQETQETVHLATLRDGNVVYLDKIDSKHVLRIFSRIGNQAPCYCTGLGKALIAWLPEEEIGRIVKDKKMVKFTENTIAGIKELKKELQIIREQGFSVDNQEHELGIRCVAVPVRNRTGKVVAAVSITWPEIRSTEECKEKYKNLILKAGEQISGRLGYETPGFR